MRTLSQVNSMTKSMMLAVAQTKISQDVRENGQEIRRLIGHAASQGARLIHFPEAAASGYPKTQIHNWANVDWTSLQDELENTAEFAGKMGVFVVLGSNHRLSPPHRPHNSLYVISDNGTLVDRYDKRVCSNTEITDWYTPGFKPTVFEVDGLKFGCALCIEVHFSEIFEAYRALDFDCMLLSSYSNDPIFDTTARAHASMNGYWLSHSVPSNFEQPLSSCIVGPDGHVQTRSRTDGNSLVFATIGPESERWVIPLKKARSWRDSAREGIIYRKARVNDPRSSERTRF